MYQVSVFWSCQFDLQHFIFLNSMGKAFNLLVFFSLHYIITMIYEKVKILIQKMDINLYWKFSSHQFAPNFCMKVLCITKEVQMWWQHCITQSCFMLPSMFHTLQHHIKLFHIPSFHTPPRADKEVTCPRRLQNGQGHTISGEIWAHGIGLPLSHFSKGSQKNMFCFNCSLL